MTPLEMATGTTTVVAVLAGVAFAATLALIAYLIVRSDDRRHKQRSESLRRYANGRGWEFAATGNPDLTPFHHVRPNVPALAPYSCDNVMSGPYRDRQAVVFEYTHTLQMPMGGGSADHHYHLVGLRLPGPTPALSVERGRTPRRSPITLRDPAFRQDHRVTTTDPDFAAAVLDAGLAALTRELGIDHWALDGGYLLLVRTGRLPLDGPPDDRRDDPVDPLLDVAARMVEALPPAIGDGTGR